MACVGSARKKAASSVRSTLVGRRECMMVLLYYEGRIYA